MKILVTGAGGYLGQGIVKHILDNGHNVIAADFSTDHIDERADKRAVDLFSIEDPYNYFRQPDVLLHLAWRDGFVHYSDAHINDLSKHYEFIQKFAVSKVRTIAVMGSMHEIGFFEGSINENTPCNPVTPYGISKNALRDLTSMLCKQKQKNFMWLRGYYIVGNSQYGSSIFSKITAAETEGKAEFPFTMGQNQFDFIDYDDFCAQVARAVCQTDVMGVINICSGHPEKLADRVERFIVENDYKIKLKYGAFPDRPYDSKAVWGDSRKIEEIMKMFIVTWNEDNAKLHLQKHNIDFNELKPVLRNPTTILDLEDPIHNNFYALGFRSNGTLLRISYDIEPDGTYFIHTAFKADAEDRKRYVELSGMKLFWGE